MRIILIALLLTGCSHKVTWGQPEAGMTTDEKQAVQTVLTRHEQLLEVTIKSLGEVREKLGMNEEKK